MTAPAPTLDYRSQISWYRFAHLETVMSTGRILVTGATGFVGRHLLPHLLSARRHLTLAVREADSCPSSWKDSVHVRIVVTGPIESTENLEEALSGVS